MADFLYIFVFGALIDMGEQLGEVLNVVVLRDFLFYSVEISSYCLVVFTEVVSIQTARFEVSALTQELVLLAIHAVEWVLFAVYTEVLVHIHALFENAFLELFRLLLGPGVEHKLVEHGAEVAELQVAAYLGL